MSAVPATNTLLRVAEQLTAAGLSVIPIGSLQRKSPDSDLLPRDSNDEPTWAPYQQHIAERADLERWFGPASGLAVVGGTVSGGLTILDFDVRETRCLFDDFRTLVDSLAPGLMDRLPLIGTQSGGRHLYFRAAECTGSTKLAQTTDRHALIETRGQGGYALAPVSRGYRAVSGTLRQVPTITLEERAVLFAAARSLDEAPPEPVRTTESLPGAAYNVQASLADMERLLSGAGWHVVGTRHDGTRLVRRPGKQHGISATLGQGGHKSLYVFSSNAAPFEANQGYAPFAVYAQLVHQGDYTAAARALAREGYGDAPERPPLRVVPETAVPVPAPPTDDAWYVEQGQPNILRVTPEMFLSTTLVNLLRESAASMDMPVEFFAAPLLAVLGAAIGATWRIRITDDFFDGAAIWSGIVGPPGSGKTPAIKRIVKPLHAIQKRWRGDFGKATTEHEHDMAYWETQKFNVRGDKPEEPKLRRILASDTTLEALVPLLRDNPRGLLIDRDELYGWILSFNQYKKGGGADRESWLSIWNNTSFSVDRKIDNFAVYVEHPFVCVTGGIQPAKLQALLSGMEDGFTDRLLLFWPPATPLKLNTPTIPPAVADAYSALIERLIAIERTVNELGEPVPRVVQLSSGAYRLFERRFNRFAEMSCDPDTPEPLAHSYGKLSNLAARIALILHVCQEIEALGEPMGCDVTLETMQAAWMIVDCAASNLAKVHGDLALTRRDLRARRAVEWVGRHGGTATVRDIVRANVGGIRTASEALSLLQELTDRHLGLLILETAGGKERHVFTLPGGAA